MLIDSCQLSRSTHIFYSRVELDEFCSRPEVSGTISRQQLKCWWSRCTNRRNSSSLRLPNRRWRRHWVTRTGVGSVAREGIKAGPTRWKHAFRARSFLIGQFFRLNFFIGGKFLFDSCRHLGSWWRFSQNPRNWKLAVDDDVSLLSFTFGTRMIVESSFFKYIFEKGGEK